MPLASELEASDDNRKLRTLYIVASRVALGIAVPIAVVLSLLGGAILTLWVGAEYDEYAPLVMVLAVASLAATSQWPATEVLQGMARHHVAASAALAAGIANIALSVLLLPAFGLLGVAFGTLIPAVVASIGIVMPFANRTLQVSWRAAATKIWLPGLAPGIAAAGCLWMLQRHFQPDSIGAVAGLSLVTALIYGAGYLSAPASRAERQLLADLVMGLSRTIGRMRMPPAPSPLPLMTPSSRPETGP
jgi:O-antigen/teichoic acid export membrane protein